MVKHDILVRGVDMGGTESKRPVLLQMHDDDFPARFLQDLASPGQPPTSHTTVVNPAAQPLLQPVQRILHLAVAKLNCNTLGFPRIDPLRVQSAGLVIRRVFRGPGVNGSGAIDDPSVLSAWMRSPDGRCSWVRLRPDQEKQDPDPTKRRQLYSGQAELDRQLAALALAQANAESTTPAFLVPPATCASLNETVAYAVIPTASSDVSDTQPKQPPQFDRTGLLASLPQLLRAGGQGSAPLAGTSVDSRWLSDDFLNTIYPPTVNGSSVSPDNRVSDFHGFSTALRMLDSVFGAFDGTAEGNAVLQVLNRHNVTLPGGATQAMGEFYRSAKEILLDQQGGPTIAMPTSWDTLTGDDQSALLDVMVASLTPRSQNLLAPQGRFQDPSRLYRLRLFFRIKGETPGCPPELVWSDYSEPFRIAAWYESGNRPRPPVLLPDPSQLVKRPPDCAFQVPGSLMGAIQGSSMSGLMNGSAGGGVGLGWICGFNIPLITICAFFVLNIFLSLLNIVFFWLPFIKICIPFPAPSSSAPDEGTP